jgi:CheY-like chemotaxis protein
MKLLVVEDDDDLRDIIRQVLSDANFEVETATHGGEALELLTRGCEPNLILLDLMMPVMNGWAFRERQLANPRLAAIPVLIMTAANNLDDAAIDGVGLIRKPVNLQDLLNMVRAHARSEHALNPRT